MLGGEDFEDVTSPPPDPPAPGQRRPQRRRFPDTITPPSARPSAVGDWVDREEWLGVAEWEWLAALGASRTAPPDAWFGGRLQDIAEAAARKAGALELFDDSEEMRWEAEPIVDSLTLSYELRPDGTRPGPPTLWAQFDRRVDRLAAAMKDGTAGAIRRALEELSLTLHDIADSLARYRGRYGNWQAVPPSDEAEEWPGGGSPDPPEATE